MRRRRMSVSEQTPPLLRRPFRGSSYQVHGKAERDSDEVWNLDRVSNILTQATCKGAVRWKI